MDPIILNTKQQDALTKVKEFIIQKDHKSFYLFGYAGTGKSFITKQIVKDLIDTKSVDQIYICAPTHTALKVIESYFGDFTDKIIRFMTIHKLLECRPFISNKTGEQVYRSKKSSKYLKPINRKLIIIDECSMISREIVESLNTYQSKIIFLGDPAQLPPVREQISLVFSGIPPDYQFHIILDEIMRTKSDDIKQVSTLIRQWNKNHDPDSMLVKIHEKKIKSFHLYHRGTVALKSKWFRSYIEQINNGKSPIILTWKNETADFYNRLIRKYLLSDKYQDDFTINDNIMFTKYYKACTTDKTDTTYFYTANIVKIISITTKSEKLFDWSSLKINETHPLKASGLVPRGETKNTTDVAFNKLLTKLNKFPKDFSVDIYEVIRPETQISFTIQVISRKDFNEYQKVLNNIREHLEYFYSTQQSDTHSNKLWKAFHENLKDPYAEISYGYSITIHKSQGSTFDSTMVDVSDIFDNPNVEEAMKAWYTGSTRASESLSFIMDN